MAKARARKAAPRGRAKTNAKAKARSMSKTELVGRIADATELTKRDVNSVLESLSEQIGKSMGRRGRVCSRCPDW